MLIKLGLFLQAISIFLVLFAFKIPVTSEGIVNRYRLMFVAIVITWVGLHLFTVGFHKRKRR